MSWHFYDFDANWDSFLDIWKSDWIQMRLDEQMSFWCEAYLNGEMIWVSGDMLWKYDKTRYWDDKIFDIVQASADNYYPNYLKKWIASHERFGIQYATKDVARHSFFNSIDYYNEDMYRDSCPKVDTIHAFYLPYSKHILTTIFYEICASLIPNTNRVWLFDRYDNDIILLSDDKIIFDLDGFYRWKYDKDVLQNDAYYDSILQFSQFGDEYNDEGENTDF